MNILPMSLYIAAALSNPSIIDLGLTELTFDPPQSNDVMCKSINLDDFPGQRVWISFGRDKYCSSEYDNMEGICPFPMTKAFCEEYR